MKIDLHVHSRHSKRPSKWVLQKIGCPESFTAPARVYEIAKLKGMTHVTIADHNTISGALEIAHLPNTFISCEVTTYFPENQCKLHVVVSHITEKQFADIQKARANVYDLVNYLNTESIFHIVAHPLYAVNDRLEPGHFEKMLLLFKNFELNGARSDVQNQMLKKMLMNLDEPLISQLSCKHGIEPTGNAPWIKNLTGGSDDHSGLNIARTYTMIPDAENICDAFDMISNGKAQVVTEPSTPKTMAHNLYGIAYQFYRNKFNIKEHIGKDTLLKFLDNSLGADHDAGSQTLRRIHSSAQKPPAPDARMPETLMSLLRKETEKFIKENPNLLLIAKNETNTPGNAESAWYNFVNHVSHKMINAFANHIMENFVNVNLFDIFHTIGSAGGMYFLLSPYFISFSHFTKDKALTDILSRQLLKENEVPEAAEGIRVAHFTDTFHQVNGVSKTIQQMVRAAIKTGKNYTVITCDAQASDLEEGIQNFRPIGVSDLPEYPEVKLYYPPFLEMLSFCYEKGFTHIHSATPGPIGMAALAIAHILKLPVVGTYHTQFPQYARFLTGDNDIEELTWRYTLWYYNKMDLIYVPSHNTKDELIDKGIAKEKIKLFPRGIDIDRFHPEKRNGFLKTRYQIQEEVCLLYVGRVSKEKNLHVLTSAFRLIAKDNGHIHLVVVGDGPYLTEMKEELEDFPATFTGYLKGEDLSMVYASSDIFVFPSTTDTFGNVILEAQSSGIPVVVTDEGGPCENMIPKETGLVVSGKDPDELASAALTLAQSPDLRREMGKAARRYMKERSFESAFLKTWEMMNLDSQKTRVKETSQKIAS